MSVNWTKLVATGRAKDIGVSWNEEELQSLVEIAQAKGLSFVEVAPVVKKFGPLSVEEYDERSQEVATRGDLETRAAQLGVAISQEIPDTVLESEIEKAFTQKKKEAEKKSKELQALADKEKAIIEDQTKPAKKAAKKTAKKGAKKEK